ncbi:MAG: bifunctional metallophosphatase/5'-nucleotidase, partial [Bacteroidales bacterium]|nr:bifunctional metallophosphatase/5'-nucleotidase [Bacteroidales bacterium]
MSKPRLNMLILTIFVLFSASCSQQKIILSGVIHNRTDHSSELLEAKLLRDNETKSGRRYKNSAVGPDGSFQMKIKPERSYILEISGDEGYGRVFLPAECLGEKIDISYPVKETIVIFHTNDRHFDFNHEDELVRTIEEARARYNDVFLFEAGDIFVRHASRWTVNDGQPNDTAWYGERALQLVQKMNDLGYDVMTLGNHELAYIKDYTRQALDAARFPILAANMQINTDKLPQPKPFTILNTSTGNHITVLGLSYDNSKRNGVKELDLNETVNKYLPSKNSAAINLVLSHIGLEKDLLLASSFPQFDAIIGGHSHSLLEIPILENSVLIAQAGGNPHTMSDK